MKKLIILTLILFSAFKSYSQGAFQSDGRFAPTGNYPITKFGEAQTGFWPLLRRTQIDSIASWQITKYMLFYCADSDSIYQVTSTSPLTLQAFKLGSVDLTNYYTKTQSDLRYLQGSGTNNYLPIFNSSGQLQNSTVTDDGTDIYFNYRGIRGNQIYGNFFATNASYGGVNDSGIAVIKTNGNIAIQKPYTFIKRYTDLYGYQPALGFIPENVVNKSTSLSPNDNVTYPTTAAVNTGLNAKYNLSLIHI